MKYLLVIDMQKDFVDGSLGNPDAEKIIPKIVEKVNAFDGKVVLTRDTHPVNYLSTQEGRNLPVEHCIKGTDGWQLVPELEELRCSKGLKTFDKPSFGSVELAKFLSAAAGDERAEEIELCGVCTDICVISNALLLKAFLPETPVFLDASCCAGTSRENHENALKAMKMCQIMIRGE